MRTLYAEVGSSATTVAVTSSSTPTLVFEAKIDSSAATSMGAWTATTTHAVSSCHPGLASCHLRVALKRSSNKPDWTPGRQFRIKWLGGNNVIDVLARLRRRGKLTARY